jgi:hypothetical protein
MRLKPMPEGGFVIDAEDFGPLLGVEAPRVPELMRESRITRRSEREGEDEGRFRLTFWYDQTTLQLVVRANGTVIGQRHILSAPPR